VVKLYDLTTLCSESLIDSLNQFTFPVAMLLYRVACKLKHNPETGKPYNPVNIQHLLNNCLKLLDKTKYPQVITYIIILVTMLITNIIFYLSDCYSCQLHAV